MPVPTLELCCFSELLMILNPSSLFFSDISDVEVEERDESDEDEGFGSSVKRVLEKN